MTVWGADTTFLIDAEVAESPRNKAALALIRRTVQQQGDQLAIAPQVLAEFVHVVTDARRFERPFTPAVAIAKARLWWNAREVHRVMPVPAAVGMFLHWMEEFRLGRKRILDTLLAATYSANGINHIVSSNARDYHVFGCFTVIEP